MSGLRQREPQYENRRLLDLAHYVQECMNCGKFVPTGCEPAHENSQGGGKGFGTKSHDNRHAALCHECHAWLDQGKGKSPCGVWAGDRGGKHAMWVRAHLRTFDLYWRSGWLSVERR